MLESISLEQQENLLFLEHKSSHDLMAFPWNLGQPENTVPTRLMTYHSSPLPFQPRPAHNSSGSSAPLLKSKSTCSSLTSARAGAQEDDL